MSYYLYVNHRFNRARIHREDCYRIQNRKPNGPTHYWVPFDRYTDARYSMEQTGKQDRGDCAFCKPSLLWQRTS